MKTDYRKPVKRRKLGKFFFRSTLYENQVATNCLREALYGNLELQCHFWCLHIRVTITVDTENAARGDWKVVKWSRTNLSDQTRTVHLRVEYLQGGEGVRKEICRIRIVERLCSCVPLPVFSCRGPCAPCGCGVHRRGGDAHGGGVVHHRRSYP